MTITVGILLGFVSVFIVLTVLIAVWALRATNKMLEQIERQQERHKAQLDSVLDRLMAVDFTTYKSWQSAENAEVGGWEPPEPEEEPFVSIELPNLLA